jgi:Bacterial SH3 domain
MTRPLFLLLVPALFLLFQACGEEKSTQNAAGDAEAQATKVQTQLAVCLWDQAGLRDKAGKAKDARWIAAVNFGEIVTLTGNTAEDATDNNRKYIEVELSDGKKGWTAENLFALHASRAVAMENIDLFKRPELTTLSGTQVPRGELLALVPGEKEGWSEAVGREKKVKGWIRSDAPLSEDEVDVTIAIMIDKALREKNPDKQQALFDAISGSSTLKASPLISLVEEKKASIAPLPELPANQLYIMAAKVNVRSTPDNEADNVVFQVDQGNICNILERGDRIQIRELDDYWYKIEKDGREGWVYGAYTSKKIVKEGE